jgi:hypothetical protein
LQTNIEVKEFKVLGSKVEEGLVRLRKNFKTLLANTSLYYIFTNTIAISKRSEIRAKSSVLNYILL